MGITNGKKPIKKYKDEEWLRTMYVDNKLPLQEIANKCGCSLTPIISHAKKYGFEMRRNPNQTDFFWIGKGENSNTWKGGKYVKDGYIMIRRMDHPNRMANGYVAEHRLKMEDYLGRLLDRSEKVHHLNGKRDDNRIENLCLIDQKSHLKKHSDMLKEYYLLKKENQGLKILLASLAYANQTESVRS